MQAFRGGVETYDSAANAWTDAGKTFRAALVQTIGVTPSANWRFLNEFTANNPLIADQVRPTVTGRILEPYNATEKATICKWTDELVFGSPAAGPSAPGVIVYEDTGDPATSVLWTYDDNAQSFPLLIRGGETKWGAVGPNNEILRLIPGQLTTATLAGALKDIKQLANPWNPAGPYTFAIRLILSTGTMVPNNDWETLADMASAGVAWADVPSGDIQIPGASRAAAGWNLIGSNNRWQYTIAPPAQLQWTSVPAGQSIGAAVLYRSTGNDATASVWHWDANFTAFTSNGGNITYGSGAQQVINYGQH